MAKPDKATLQNEIKELKAIILDGRKKTLNFAILQGKDSMVIAADLKRPPGSLRRDAKAKGGGAKGIQGQLNVEGKKLILTVDEEPPGNFPKLIKSHFAQRDCPIRVVIKIPGGIEVTDGEDGDDDNDTIPQAAQVAGAAQTPEPPIGTTAEAGGKGGIGTPGATPEPPADTPKDKPADSPNDSTNDSGVNPLDAILRQAYQTVQEEMRKKLETADEASRKAIEFARDAFEKALESQEYADAKKGMSALKKALVKAVEETSFLGGLMDKVTDKIGDVVEDVTEFGTAAENQYEAFKNKAAEVLDEALETTVDVLKSIGDRVGILSEADEKQKERLAEFDLSEERQLELVQLSRHNPKAFEAAVTVLAKMEAESGDLVATPEGLEETRKRIVAAKAKVDAELAKYRAATAEIATKEAERDAASTAAATAKAELEAAQAALQKLLDGLPKDQSKLTEAQRALVAERKAALEAKVTTATTKLTAADALVVAKTADVTTAQAAGRAQYQVYSDSYDARSAEQKTLAAAQTKKDMLDSLAHGALSPDAKNPLADADIAKVLSAYTVDPAFGKSALALVENSKDRSLVAEGVDKMVKGLANEFKDKDGNAFGDADTRRKYAADALKMGAALGGDYFERMDAFVQNGGLNAPSPVTFQPDKTLLNPVANETDAQKKAREDKYTAEVHKLEQLRAKHVGDAMLDENGKLAASAPKAKQALDVMNFHPESMTMPMPGMNANFAQMAKTLDDPAHKQKCQDVLDGITTPPAGKTGRDLVGRNIGKTGGDVTADDVKSSVMSAMMTPLNQGPVGSCFSTGPARRQLAEDPAKAMASMADIAKKGTWTTAQGETIKAIKTSKLPAEDNQLMRSWEYTVATAGAMLQDSSQRDALKTQMFSGGAGGDSLNAIKGMLPDAAKWPEIRSNLQTALAEKLTFRYDATSEIKKSSDGKSTKGNFQIIEIATGKEITTKAAFIELITRIALQAASTDKDSDLGKKIVAHCASDAFVNSVCTKNAKGDLTYAPWQLPGGGQGVASSKVLNGGAPENKESTEDNWRKNAAGEWEKIDTPAARTKQILTNLVTRFDAEPADSQMLDVRTVGIHAFGGLPNHPSLAKLKEGDDPAAAIEKHLLKPGRDLAETPLETAHSAMLFDQQLDNIARWSLYQNGAALLATARESRPTTALKPPEIKALVVRVTAALRDYIAAQRSDAWKADQVAAGKVVSNAEYAKKLAEWVKIVKGWIDGNCQEVMIKNLEPPEFVFADSNWGSGDGHVFFVVIADPVTGAPTMFERHDPDGSLTPMDDEWLDTSWQITEK